MTDQKQERRGSQRVDANLKLAVTMPGDGGADAASLETINISTSGVYFRSAHFIEPMTKLAMEIEVGVSADDGTGRHTTAPVTCEGLVVRTSPEAEVEGCDNYEVAVFFTNITPEGMANLERHIALLVDTGT